MAVTQVYSAVASIFITKTINQDTYSKAADKSNEQAASQYVNFNSKDFRTFVSFFFFSFVHSSLV